MLAVTDLLHHRNRKRSGGHDICDRTAGHRTHKAAGDDGRLGRTAGEPAGNRIRQIDEETSGAGFIQKSAKQNKNEDKGGCHTEGQPEYTFSRQRQGSGDALHAVAFMHNQLRHVRAKIAEQQRKAGDNHQIQSDHPAGGLQNQQDQGDADADIPGAPISLAFKNALQIDKDVKADGNRNQDQHQIDHLSKIELIFAGLFVKGFG